ncbi:signal recognition particle protein [Ruminococcus sp. OA3]|uniref:signal recognition particle protein n=1 Tax=Ruminococcus sp. OA3 TaxID=2914164 RepID=UPI001F057506|nr:signal recognition particle protein [Ruminococcus sp. OA3]MCH1983689.1 signal recognition particle protein [Ruminococcus sp. OA3]
MAFESLSEKLQNVFKKLRSKGKLTEEDVKTALKEVKMALLEADVSFKVVKQFIKSVQERAVGQDVMNGLNPGQMVIKIVNEELIALMGSETTELPMKQGNAVTVFMMAGLQGAGKTTTVAKLAGKLKSKGKRPLLVACDVYRPAAIKQLEMNGEKQGVEVFSMGDKQKPVNIAKAAMEHAKNNGHNVVLLDTAGRLHIDEDMMAELAEIKGAVEIDATVLVVDAMTGQDAVNVAQMFHDKIGIDGVILTKMDGDTRGGAALSIKAVCGKPILYVGMGEKLSDLEQFYPDRMASRILGMGDVMSLIEKAQESIDEEKAREMEQKLKKAQFGFDDYLESMNQMKNMGGLSSVLSMMPGIGGKMKDLEGMVDEKDMARKEAMILSMTPKERSNPDILNVSRKQRIARGAGVDISEVNRLVKQFEQARKMMKQMPGMMGGKSGKRGGFKLPF